MSKISCSKVTVKQSLLSTSEREFDGAFANVDIKENELVEYGIVRRLSGNNHRVFDGMNNPHVFTWSDSIPNYTWAFTSGCAAFYNTGVGNQTNTRMVRYFDEDRFEIYATKDISAGDELTHTYKSLRWRTAFTDLSTELSD